jgi:hypothetical protein
MHAIDPATVNGGTQLAPQAQREGTHSMSTVTVADDLARDVFDIGCARSMD